MSSPTLSLSSMAVRNRERDAVELRVQGHSLHAITIALGLPNEAEARNIIVKYSERRNDELSESVDMIRTMEQDRMDMVLAKLFPLLNVKTYCEETKTWSGYPADIVLGAAEKIIKVSARRAALFGLDKQPEASSGDQQTVLGILLPKELEEALRGNGKVKDVTPK